MHIPPHALADLHTLLSWAQRAGVVLTRGPDGTLAVSTQVKIPATIQAAIVRVGSLALGLLAAVEVPAPGLAQTIVWWEVAARQLSPEGRALLPAATAVRRERLTALRAVHLTALADVCLSGGPLPSTR